MCFTSTLVSSGGAVPLEHGARSPTDETHEVAFCATVGQPSVGKRVSELMWTDVTETCSTASLTDELVNTTAGHWSGVAQPQLGTIRMGMGVTDTQVSVECLCRLPTKGTGPRAIAFPDHNCDVGLEIDIRHTKLCEFPASHASVNQEAKDGGVTSLGKSAPHTCFQEGTDVVVG